jgi:hypothetical protein
LVEVWKLRESPGEDNRIQAEVPRIFRRLFGSQVTPDRRIRRASTLIRS